MVNGKKWKFKIQDFVEKGKVDDAKWRRFAEPDIVNIYQLFDPKRSWWKKRIHHLPCEQRSIMTAEKEHASVKQRAIKSLWDLVHKKNLITSFVLKTAAGKWSDLHPAYFVCCRPVHGNAPNGDFLFSQDC